MASKKKSKNKKKSSVKTRPVARVAKKRGPARKCAVCGKRGHNKRSHEPGGKLG